MIAGQPPSATGTAAPSPHSPSTVRPHQSAGTSRQPVRVVGEGGSKNPSKRRRVHTESSEEEDVDMTIEDNSDSGSSVDTDEFPVKRLRTSGIVTRGSKAATNFQTTAAVVRRDGHSLDIDTDAETTIITDAEAAIATDTKPDIDTDAGAVIDTDAEADIDTDVDVDIGIDAGAGLSPSLPSGMKIDSNRRSDLNINVLGRTTPLHVREIDNTSPAADIEPSPQSPDPSLDAEPEIPGFLTAKSDIYGYLSSANEPGFKALLDGYIAFEAADHSGHRGNFPTSGRPNCVGWWIDRTRPDRLPPYDSLQSFGKSVIEWWIWIQPDWRRGLKNGRILRDGGRWDRLYQPGINGLLNVVILVYWWAKIFEERSQPVSEAYRWLVADITWILSQLTRVASEGFSPE